MSSNGRYEYGALSAVAGAAPHTKRRPALRVLGACLMLVGAALPLGVLVAKSRGPETSALAAPPSLAPIRDVSTPALTAAGGAGGVSGAVTLPAAAVSPSAPEVAAPIAHGHRTPAAAAAAARNAAARTSGGHKAEANRPPPQDGGAVAAVRGEPSSVPAPAAVSSARPRVLVDEPSRAKVLE